MYYFAYASNLSRRQMSERCPGSKPKFTAILPNHKIIFTGWVRKWRGGTASIKPMQGGKVAGAIYEISESDVRLLDKHEGCPEVYDRMKVMVITADDDWVEAVTYIKREQSEEARPSPEYLAVIRQGRKDWRIV